MQKRPENDKLIDMKKLRDDIKNQTFERVYLLYGDEDFLKRSYKKRLKDAICKEDTMNILEVSDKVPDLSELKAFTDTMPFFSDYRVCILENTGLFKSASEGYDSWIQSLPETACVLFVERETDKRNRLYKAVVSRGYAVEMSHPDEKSLNSWILQYLKAAGRNIHRDAFDLFLQCITEDMNETKNELDKLIAYTEDTGVIEKEDVEEVCRIQLKNRIFDLTNHASFREKKKAFDLYYDLIALRESPMRILILLQRELGRLLSVKQLQAERKNRQECAAVLGVSPYIFDKIRSQSERYKSEQLKKLLDLSLQLEKLVKTGNLDEKQACELLLVQMTE